MHIGSYDNSTLFLEYEKTKLPTGDPSNPLSPGTPGSPVAP